MIPEYEKTIAFRLSNDQKTRIEQLIKDGKARSISALIRAALKAYLPTEAPMLTNNFPNEESRGKGWPCATRTAQCPRNNTNRGDVQ